ncbi:MAG: helix-turn-helix domain-containing protein [Gloeomargarita sp. DG02_3_bins_56]
MGEAMMSHTKETMVSLLREFIRSNPDARELKRALAVRMALEEKPYAEIAQFLEVNKSFITVWKQQFYEQGIAGLKLGYSGRKSYLEPRERQEVIQWLKAKNYWNLDELVTHLDGTYNVIYQSKQSYYNLFAEAGITWKKSKKKINPKSEPGLAKKKKRNSKTYSKKSG